MKIAIIDESLCVGCSKCLPACPVDAIVGSLQFMHTVLKDECIGCGLCIEPCPMDCISMIDSKVKAGSEEKRILAEKAKTRYLAKKNRILKNKLVELPSPDNMSEIKERMLKEIEEANMRVSNKRQHFQNQDRKTDPDNAK